MLPRRTIRLSGIDPQAWEHPADRAVLLATQAEDPTSRLA
jgi:hypothetical protein